MPSTGAGSRNRLIRIEELVETRTAGSREVSREWVLLDEPWAAVSGGAGSEAVEAGQPSARAVRTFNIRYREGLTPSEQFRVVFEGQVFDITSVLEVGRRREMDVTGYARAEVPA